MGTFGERYREAWALWRERNTGAGETETDFAKACGIPMSTASPYKNQIEAPIHARVLAIARTAGVDPGWLAYGEDSKAPDPELPAVQEPEAPKIHPLQKEVTRFPVAEPIIHQKKDQKGKGRKRG